MTTQTNVYDDAPRLNDTVREAMESFNDDHDGAWSVEYEIPAETNGWVYVGDGGAPATSATWVDQYPNPNESVGVILNSTHPRNDSRDVVEVFHVADMDAKIDSRTEIATFEGEQYRTPLHVTREMFWKAVNAAIEWMEANPP